VADTKISALAALTGANAATGDLLDIVDISDTSMGAGGTNKQISLLELEEFLERVAGLPRIKRLNSQHSVTGVTGTKVTDLDMALPVGTHTFKYSVLNRSATATTGVGLGVNFTGTAAVKGAMRRNVSSITTASNGVTEGESGAALVTGGVMNAWYTRAYSTTAPTMMAEGVETTGVDLLDIIEGLIIVTVAGNLELWHSSQIAATTTTLEIGSSLVAIQTA
jgi:hypothetical protein